MSGFTPGPWTIDSPWEDRCGGSVAIVNRDHYGEGWDVAQVHSSEANARLIAAAPDSHTANLQFVEACAITFGINETWTDSRVYDELPSTSLAQAYFVARAAIAKATGEAR